MVQWIYLLHKKNGIKIINSKQKKKKSGVKKLEKKLFKI